MLAVSKTSLSQSNFGVCACTSLSGFVWIRTYVFIYGFQNNLAKLFSKFKALADDPVRQSCVTQKLTLVGNGIENILGKEDAAYQYFFLFPKCFRKAYLRVVKILDCVVNSYYFTTK